MPGQPLPAGGIYNSNRFVLNALLRRLGCEVLDLGIVPDSREATRQALREAAEGADLIISAGGVSVGEENHVRPTIEAEEQAIKAIQRHSMVFDGKQKNRKIDDAYIDRDRRASCRERV